MTARCGRGVTIGDEPRCWAPVPPPYPYSLIAGCWLYYPGRAYAIPDWRAHAEWLRTRTTCPPGRDGGRRPT